MFINSLPLLFTDIGYASPIELLIIFLGAWIVLYIATPVCEKDGLIRSSESYLLSAWNGNSSLKWVFWPFFILLNISLYTTDMLAKTGAFTVSSWDDVHFALLLPTVWWITGVWRCSAHSNARLWSAGARLMTISVCFEYGLKLLLRIDYPRLFFNCEDLLMDYGSCF